LAEYERGETPTELVEQARDHEREAEQHKLQLKAHEEVKKQHHSFVTKWNLLMSALVLKPSRRSLK
jgi:hypothetical protein